DFFERRTADAGVASAKADTAAETGRTQAETTLLVVGLESPRGEQFGLVDVDDAKVHVHMDLALLEVDAAGHEGQRALEQSAQAAEAGGALLEPERSDGAGDQEVRSFGFDLLADERKLLVQF